MYSAKSSTSSMGAPEGVNGEMRMKRLAGGQDSRAVKVAGLQQSILNAILVDPLPVATSPARLLIVPRPPSISIIEQNELGEGKENNGGRLGNLKDRSGSIEDDEVFELCSQQRDYDQVDVTMSVPLTPSTPIASETTLVAPCFDRTLGTIKNASSFLDLTSASTTSSIYNRSLRPKSLALEELPDEWRTWLRACTDGDIESAMKVLRKEPTILNWSPPFTGRLAGLHLATRGNHLKMVTWLCLQGADVNHQTLNQSTALHIAAQQTNRGMVNELRRLGADESKLDLFGRRYSHYASWGEEHKLGSKDSFHSCSSGRSYESVRERIRSRPPSISSRDSMASAASSFGRTSSIRDTVRGFFRNTFKKAHSTEKLQM
ncbi:hypothetical protein PMAYCL1PPCAC_26647 [Pristionchus mayeri]|uniref:Uncharacterized protein n=1 Tax=Pristionchus mayeri TaxID=1317129 RepID=A0AAN5D692_9BILA|nr:hypothetical protein PMAYCL1PPCAC_26647 [Pristionchus mayeri]